MSIIHPKDAMPLCSAIVDLVSQFERPFRFRVTVRGLPPHAHTRIYEITAPSDRHAAQAGIDRFVRSCSSVPWEIIDAMDR
jgi:hypothetical protein